jgi:hypothetical protein
MIKINKSYLEILEKERVEWGSRRKEEMNE